MSDAKYVALHDELYQVAINCPHEINAERVILHFDPKQPGHNALNQLALRLDAQLGKRFSDGNAEIARLREQLEVKKCSICQSLGRYMCAKHAEPK